MRKKTPIKVMIVDDHPVVRNGIINMFLIFDDIEFIGEAGGGRELLTMLPQVVPDVILMDMVMPGMDGLQTSREILANYPDIKIVFLTTFPEGDVVRDALEAGAVGFLTKDAEIDALADAVRAAYAGQTVLAPEATVALMQAKASAPKVGHDLSERELEVLALLVEGLSNSEIAEELTISPSTAKHHVSACISKLGVAKRGQAALLALELELVPQPPAS